MRENLRKRAALDTVPRSVMMADGDNKISYVNLEALELFHSTEREINGSLPGFRAPDLCGMSIDGFHGEPAHQQRMVVALTGTYSSVITLGGLTFGFTANPVVLKSVEYSVAI